jgi:hypothetical protein
MDTTRTFASIDPSIPPPLTAPLKETLNQLSYSPLLPAILPLFCLKRDRQTGRECRREMQTDSMEGEEGDHN